MRWGKTAGLMGETYRDKVEISAIVMMRILVVVNSANIIMNTPSIVH